MSLPVMPGQTTGFQKALHRDLDRNLIHGEAERKPGRLLTDGFALMRRFHKAGDLGRGR